MSEPPVSALPAAENSEAFFILRDSRDLFQKRLTEIAQRAGVIQQKTIDAFGQEIAQAHDDLASSAGQEGFEQTAGLTASRISLVGNDDLELEIRVGEIIHRLKGNDQIDHWRVLQRYMTLLQRPQMTTESNPVGMAPISRGLWVICDESGGTLDRKLDRLQRLEEQLQLQLPEVYAELNRLLEQRHVDAAQPQMLQRASGGTPPPSNGQLPAGGTPFGNPLAALQQTLGQRSAGELSWGGGFTAAGSGDGNGGGGFNASAMLMLSQLTDRLYALDALPPAGSPESGTEMAALRAKDLGLPPGGTASIALDTLSLIFEAIFADPELPDSLKAAIGRLQIPLIRLAITDATFFSDTQHPGRQLVNRMARAALGLPRDSRRDHPVCQGLSKLADSVRTSLEANDSDLSPHLAELEAQIAGRDQALQAAAQPYRALVDQHEQREAAHVDAERWLADVSARTPHPALRSFFSEHWLRVMHLAHAPEGMNGARWRDAAATIEELLWSVQPKTDAEERQRLAALIPALLKRINAGLDLLQLPSEARTPFLNACFDLQTAALRSRPVNAPPSEAPPPPAAKPAPTAPSADLSDEAGRRVLYLRSPTPATPWRGKTTDGAAGDWISFTLPDGERLCGRHCGFSARNSSLLLFNPDWAYAVALSPALLEQQLRDDRARLVSNLTLFDAAAERALGELATR